MFSLLLASSIWQMLFWLMMFGGWLLVWMPVVALLEYATHRWIMHKANRPLDPDLSQLRAHGKHHQGDLDHELIDMPVRNALRLTSPFFLLVFVWGLAAGDAWSVTAPAAALLTWSFLYTYLWNRMHRAIHGLEMNWFRRSGILFRVFRRHHVRHHQRPRTNFGTVFPLTDYLFFTWAPGRTARHSAVTVRQALLPAPTEAAC